MARQPRWSFLSVEDYLQLDSNSFETRYEYVDGYVTMLAGGTANHATIGVNITSILRSLLRGSPCHVYNSDLRVRIAETRYFYPDATVSCDEQDRGQSDMIRSPRLVVEVLSSGTEAFDRGKKFAFYRECPTIQEYVLINTQYASVEVFRHEKNSLWTFHAFGPDDEVKLASIAVHFPVAAVYEDVLFPPEHDDIDSLT